MAVRCAFVLAAGLGTRLGPLTQDRPKAMVELAGRPMIEPMLHRLIAAGVQKIVVNIHYKPQPLIEYLNQFARTHHTEIVQSFEPELLGTGGALALAASRIDAPFWMVNCDVDTDIDFADSALAPMIDAVASGEAAAGLVLRKDARAKQFGSFETQDSYISRMLDSAPACRHDLMFTGMQLMGPVVFDYVQAEFGSIFAQFYLPAFADGQRFWGYEFDGYWKDLGTPEDLQTARNRARTHGL